MFSPGFSSNKILNASHCRLILNLNESVPSYHLNRNNKKLLGVNLNNRIGFDTHVTNIRNRVSKKLYTSA